MNTRKQFIILDGEVMLVFVRRGEKFSQCSSYQDVTAEVDCKVWTKLSDLDIKNYSI